MPQPAGARQAQRRRLRLIGTVTNPAARKLGRCRSAAKRGASRGQCERVVERYLSRNELDFDEDVGRVMRWR